MASRATERAVDVVFKERQFSLAEFSYIRS
jgi:hypothetical protein